MTLRSATTLTGTRTTKSGTRQGGIVGVSGIFRPYNRREELAMHEGIVARREARIETIRELMAAGLRVRGISNRLGYSHVSGLINWLKTNSPALREELRVYHAPGAGRALAHTEAVKRLKLLVMLKDAGVSPGALAAWGNHNFPLGDYESALEDYAGDELELELEAERWGV